MKEPSTRLIEDFQWMTAPSDPAVSPWIWLAGAALVLALAAGGFFVFRRRTGHLPFLAPPAPHEMALRELRELAALMREETDREFVQGVSGILREYIQARFGLRAPHRSTEEFLREARQSELLPENHQRVLARFLSQCDSVKFARRRAAVPEMQTLLLAARAFVEGTVPRGEPEAVK